MSARYAMTYPSSLYVVRNDLGWILQWLNIHQLMTRYASKAKWIGGILGNRDRLLEKFAHDNISTPDSEDVTKCLLISLQRSTIDVCVSLGVRFCEYEVCLAMISAQLPIVNINLLAKLTLPDMMSLLHAFDRNTSHKPSLPLLKRARA